MAVDQTPEELAHWICKEMQTNKKQAEYTIPWLLLLPVTAKLKIKESSGSGFHAEPGLDLGEYEHWTLASKLPRKGKIMSERASILGEPERPIMSEKSLLFLSASL